MRWIKGIAILIFILPLVVYSQKPSIQLEVDPKVIAANEVFSITVKTSINGEVDLDLPDEYVHGYNVMNGMEQDVDYSTGKIITYYYVSQTGTFRKPGNYKIGPAIIKKGGKVYKSASVNLQVNGVNNPSAKDTELTAKQLRQPAFGVIETSKKQLFVGEPITVNAKVFSRFDPTHLEAYKPYIVQGVLEKHDLGNESKIMVDEEYVKRTLFYSFEYDKKVIFPEQIGKLTIEPFRLILRRGLDGVPITSSLKTIEVLPLPKNAPKAFSGGVGQFNFQRKLKRKKAKQGEVLDVEIMISGKGNMHAIEAPKFQLPEGLKLYGDPEVNEDFVFGNDGAEGKITFLYHVKSVKSGDIMLPASDFAYFDPEKERYIILHSPKELLDIEINPDFAENSEVIDQFSEVPITDPEKTGAVSERKNTKQGSDWSKWILITTPLSLALIGGILLWGRQQSIVGKRKASPAILPKEKSEAEKELARQKYANGEFLSAIQFAKKSLILSAIRYLKHENETLSALEVITFWKVHYPEDGLLLEFESALKACDQLLYSAFSDELNTSVIFQHTLDLSDKLNA